MTDRIAILREQCANYGIRITTSPHINTKDPNLMGSYNSTTRTITIAQGLSHAQQLVTLQHEYIHAMHDEHDTWDPDPQIEEARTRRETASALISPVEYRLAEQVYGPDLWQIAGQLGVTVQVVQDWRSLVRDNPQIVRVQKTRIRVI